MRIIFLFSFIFLFIQANSQELTLQEKISKLKKENQNLQEIQKQIETTTVSFEEVCKNTDYVYEQSTLNLRENMIRVIAGGLKDMFESIETYGNWVSGVTLITVKIVSYYRDQHMGNVIQSDYHNQQVNMDGIVRNMEMLSDKNHEVYKKVFALDYLVRLPLEEYDDDNRDIIRLFPEIIEYWKDADDLDDNETERSTRKLNILRNVSKKASDQLHLEISKMKSDIEKIKSTVDANNKRIQELESQVDTWNANLSKPEKIDYSTPETKPEPVDNSGSIGWNDCLFKSLDAREIEFDLEGRGEEWEKRMKEYHAKGYRFNTRVQLDCPKEILFGNEVKIGYNYVSPNLSTPAAIYQYETKITVNGKDVDPKISKNYQPGANKIVATLSSCGKPVDKAEATINLVHPIEEATVYWEDPVSEIAYKRAVSFTPKIQCPAGIDPKRNLNYFFKYIFNDVEQDSRNNYKFSPHLSLLTPGKHEVVVQLFDGFTNQLVDQYLHHLTVLEPENGATTAASQTTMQKPQTNNAPDYRNMEGKRVLALDLGWAKYEYVFRSNQVRIEGYYFWNNQKVNYTSEPLKSYTAGTTGIPGMLMTKTSGYHIYQTIDDCTGTCGKYIITEMKGTNIKILYRLNACSFNIIPAPDASKITIKYSETQGAATKEITLY